MGPFDRTGQLQKARIVVQGQYDGIHLEHELFRVPLQVPLLHRLAPSSQQGLAPGVNGMGQFVTDWPGTIVILGCATDVNAPLIDFHGHSPQPVLKQRTQTRQAARQRQHGREALGLEATVILLDHSNLNILARAEMREHPALAHASAFGQHTDGQALQPLARCQIQGNIENGGAGLLTLAGAMHGG